MHVPFSSQYLKQIPTQHPPSLTTNRTYPCFYNDIPYDFNHSAAVNSMPFHSRSHQMRPEIQTTHQVGRATLVGERQACI